MTNTAKSAIRRYKNLRSACIAVTAVFIVATNLSSEMGGCYCVAEPVSLTIFPALSAVTVICCPDPSWRIRRDKHPGPETLRTYFFPSYVSGGRTFSSVRITTTEPLTRLNTFPRALACTVPDQASTNTQRMAIKDFFSWSSPRSEVAA